MNPLYYVKKSIREPELIEPFLRQRFAGHVSKLKTVFYKSILKNQKVLIHKELDKSGTCVIVLDACRYDILSSAVDVEVEPVFNQGRNTFEYVRNTFDGFNQPYSFKYVSGAIPVNSNDMVFDDEHFQRLYQGYRPADYLDIIDAWRSAWDKELGTSRPVEVTEKALETDSSSMVVHYFQPHAPYIGEEQEVLDGTTLPGKGEPSDKQVWERVESGEISDERLKELYCSNLRYVLREVQRLIECTEFDRYVITADHGELLGESSLYGHPDNVDHPKVRVVPWMVLNDDREVDALL